MRSCPLVWIALKANSWRTGLLMATSHDDCALHPGWVAVCLWKPVSRAMVGERCAFWDHTSLWSDLSTFFLCSCVEQENVHSLCPLCEYYHIWRQMFHLHTWKMDFHHRATAFHGPLAVGTWPLYLEMHVSSSNITMDLCLDLQWTHCKQIYYAGCSMTLIHKHKH